ncbi:helix-turn-helix domain-containing protein [Nocardiopsis sp. N85]|uniref:helix-turn-helix domain-containing protein n=1 Tax=Nocardiopsis sp. N85 TaxID=3029400 RepID=UPI00237EF65A|nr:helix-turn-helix domain-containing protein [Nocardiopsis sp. N85]MDE3720021.1 helix-turn-helix domain-containing protein [Nocardiopsis sp. N85]
MATIGHTLSAARVAAGFTVADLSTRTRIREPVLRAIEEEDFVLCGGDFYARGHIRGLCRALGLDPKPLLEEFDREHAGRRGSVFVPPPRHAAAVPAASRAMMEARAGGREGETGEAATAGPPVIGEGVEPDAGTERWGHFERGERLRRKVRGGRPRRRPAAAAAVPGPREPERGDGRPRDPGKRADRHREQGKGAHRPRGRRAKPRDARPDARPAPRPPVTRARSRRADAVRRHWPWALVALLVVLSVVIGVRTWREWDGGDPLSTAFTETGSGGTVDSSVLPETLEDDTAEKVAGKTTDKGAAAPDEVTVGLTASARTWLKVTDAEGEDLFTGFLMADEAKEYVTENTLTLWLGNAGGVEVSVNGEDLGAVGRSGEVKEVVVGVDGFDD